MDQKVLIAAAIVLALLPQIIELLKAAKGKLDIFISKLANKSKPDQSTPMNDDHQIDPAVWVNDLFALQQTLLANDRKEAAGLVGEAIVELVNTTTTTKSGGSRK